MNNKKKTETMRVPLNEKQELKEIGEGDIRRGLSIALYVYKEAKKNPEQIIMNDVDTMMTHIAQYYPENHYNHFHNFPAFMMKFLKQGHPDFSIMTSKRPEKVIDKFVEDDK